MTVQKSISQESLYFFIPSYLLLVTDFGQIYTYIVSALQSTDHNITHTKVLGVTQKTKQSISSFTISFLNGLLFGNLFSDVFW